MQKYGYLINLVVHLALYPLAKYKKKSFIVRQLLFHFLVYQSLVSINDHRCKFLFF